MLLIVLSFLAACGGPGSSPVGAPPGVQQGEVGNGGHGIMKAGKIYLADLVEAGIERRPFFLYASVADATRKHSPFLHQVIEATFAGTGLPVADISRKLYEIYDSDPMLAYAMAHTLQMHQWKLVEQDLKLLELKGTVFQYQEGQLVLIANRRGRTVYVHAPTIARMDAGNVTALVFHEIVYALIAPQPLLGTSVAGVAGLYDQPSARVREIIGYFFSTELANDTFARQEGVRRMISPDELPILPRHHNAPVVDADASIDSDLEKHHVLIAAPVYQLVLSEDDKDVQTLAFDRGDLARGVDGLQAICHALVHSPLASAEVRVSPDPKEGQVYELQFASFPAATQIQTYVKFTPVKDLAPARIPLIHDLADTGECLSDLQAELWRVVLEYERTEKTGDGEADSEAYRKGFASTQSDILARRLKLLDFMLKRTSRKVQAKRASPSNED